MLQKNVQLFASLLLLFVGSTFALLGTVFVYKANLLTSHGIRTTGEVVGLVRNRSSRGHLNYKPEISFRTTDGQTITFVTKVSSNTFDYVIGEKVPVIYLPDKPREAAIDSKLTIWIAPFAFAITGYSLVAIGIFVFFNDQKRKKQIAELKKTGQRITATITDISENHKIKVNGKRPYIIYSQAEINSILYVFKSENIWFDPKQYVQQGQTIEVIVDPMNPKTYFVDTTFLPKT